MTVVHEIDTWRDASDFKASVTEWAHKINVRPAQIRVQRMRRKWASCSRDGIVSFSADLLNEDRSFGEAVIVHELTHLRVRNHGRLFQSLIRSFLGSRADLGASTETRHE